MRGAPLVAIAAAFLTVALLRDHVRSLDVEILHAVRQTHNDVLTALAIGFAELGDTFGVTVAMIAFAGLFLWRRQPVRAGTLAAVVIVGCTFNATLKEAFAYARPDLFHSPYPAPGFSFPSGHAQAAVALYGTLAVLARRWYATLFCGVMAFGICWCRVYLGVHWPSDVLAGLLVGAGVLATARLALAAILHSDKPGA